MPVAVPQEQFIVAVHDGILESVRLPVQVTEYPFHEESGRESVGKFWKGKGGERNGKGPFLLETHRIQEHDVPDPVRVVQGISQGDEPPEGTSTEGNRIDVEFLHEPVEELDELSRRYN